MGATATTRYLREKLREHFGFRSFRPGQLEAVKSAMAGRDVLSIMPTGSGKSLCFQLPALELDGMTVVVSPLIALMKDQADALRARGIRVAVVNSTLSAAERRATEEAIAAGEVEFVYTTPEQLGSPEFRAVLAAQPLDLFVVDEAHCVSQWGHDFRPDYLTLGAAIEDLGRPPVLALTATATQDVIDDILTHLGIPDAEVVHTGFYRPNLTLTVLPCAGQRRKRERLLELLREVEGTGIIYCATTRAVEDVAEFLENCGVSVESYHGKMAAKRRAAAQDAFMAGNVTAMVATNAFGLGIDKPDIRFVIHFHAPGTVEAFYQEIGRAGRDGKPAACTLLYDPADNKLQRFFAGGRYPDDGDLVNVHHALKRFDGESADLPAITAICPVPKARLKVCLELLVAKGVVGREPGNKYRLLRPAMDRDQIAAVGKAYRDRADRDRLKLQEMVDYADGRGCRWATLVSYFDGDEVPGGRCGHCDNCP